MTLEEAKTKLEDVVREIQADGNMTVAGWDDGCITISEATPTAEAEVKPKELLPAA